MKQKPPACPWTSSSCIVFDELSIHLFIKYAILPYFITTFLQDRQLFHFVQKRNLIIAVFDQIIRVLAVKKRIFDRVFLHDGQFFHQL